MTSERLIYVRFTSYVQGAWYRGVDSHICRYYYFSLFFTEVLHNEELRVGFFRFSSNKKSISIWTFCCDFFSEKTEKKWLPKSLSCFVKLMVDIFIWSRLNCGLIICFGNFRKSNCWNGCFANLEQLFQLNFCILKFLKAFYLTGYFDLGAALSCVFSGAEPATSIHSFLKENHYLPEIHLRNVMLEIRLRFS